MALDADTSLKFLQKWRPEGPWVLVAIPVVIDDKNRIETRAFTKEQTEQLLAWVRDNNGKRNIYFHVNSIKNPKNKKTTKEDMYSAEWLHIDIDPKKGEDIDKEKDRCLGLLTTNLPKGLPKPTCIIFSGGGYQGFWRLEEPIVVDGVLAKCEDFELYNIRLELILGGDACHNIDRIMRLPATMNLPTKKKIEAGRVPVEATLLEFTNRSYPISAFTKGQKTQKGGSYSSNTGSGVTVDIPGNLAPVNDLDDLDQYCKEKNGLSPTLKKIIAQGEDVEFPKEKDNSRSAWLFHAICGLLKADVPDGVILSIITDPEWGISSSVVDKGSSSRRYAIRQIKRAKEFMEVPYLMQMNDKHAVIRNIGGKTKVIEEVVDPVLGRSKLTLISFADIRNSYNHIKIDLGVDGKGKPILASMGSLWLDNPKRRQFDYVRFNPANDEEGVYNLWRGFNFNPIPGDCSLFLNHLKKNVCNGVEEQYDYLIKWMARGVQYPASAGQVAIVLQGGRGVGKSIIAKHYGKLFGRHYYPIANSQHLVGNFNAHLRDVIVLFADEAFFAGDKKQQSVLKMLITEDTIPIEAKGIDLETYPNYIHLIMASNDSHIIDAAGDERRYFVLDVKDYKKQDKPYFIAIENQLEKEGGYEALLYFLQSVDLTDFQVRDIPQTEELRKQKMQSLNHEEQWWYAKLQNGRLLDAHDTWISELPTRELHDDYRQFANNWGYNNFRLLNPSSLGVFLGKMRKEKGTTLRRHDVHGWTPDGQPTTQSKRENFYNFGTLEECRAIWDDKYILYDHKWNTEEGGSVNQQSNTQPTYNGSSDEDEDENGLSEAEKQRQRDIEEF